MNTALPLTTLSVLLSVATVSAEPTTLDAETQRISMFKNGLAMITSHADVPGEGEFQVAAPEARYGSLWLGWGQGLTLNKIIATEVERTEQAEVYNMTDLLRANVGQTFSIQLHNEDAWITGKLVSMPTQPRPIPIIQPASRGYYPPPIQPTQADLLVFATDGGTLAMPPSRIAQVRFGDGEISTRVENKVKDTAIGFTAEKGDGDNSALVLRYLAQGISWSPSYVIEMIDEEKARLACKAVIVNDLMDMDGVDVELIAGYPNLKFSASPTAMGPTPLEGLLASLQQSGQPNPYGVMANAMVMQQRASYSAGGYGGDSFTADIPDLPMGEGAEDLYFYQVPNVTLAKGERGYFPLISAEIPACHVYTWDIADYVDNNDRYRQPDQNQGAQQVVWHSLDLENTTSQPWTTAPCMTVMDGRVLGQDVLNFTPPGGSSLLKITQAVSIDASQNEIEIERERNAVQFHGTTYDKVTVEGTLAITNYKDKSVTLKITKLVSGEVESTDAYPEVVKVASGLNRVNPRSKLTWETEIKPGKDNKVQITYRYSFYTR